MFAAVRHYVLESTAADSVIERSSDVEAILGSVPRWIGGQLIRTRDGLIVVMVGPDEPVVIEAGRRFASWALEHLPAWTTVPGPDVWAGDLVWSDLTPDDRRPAAPTAGAEAR